jgi:uncharacterized DUF497 family protein
MKIRVGQLVFEWDDRKAAGNAEKHGVAFEDAATIFMDGSARTYYDRHHSDDEDRYFTIGFARSGRLLTVWFTERDDRIRLIGARCATPREQQRYHANAKENR